MVAVLAGSGVASGSPTLRAVMVTLVAGLMVVNGIRLTGLGRRRY